MLRRLSRKEKKCLNSIKEKLTNDFKVVYLINTKSAEKLTSLVNDPKRKDPIIYAKIDANDEIHIIIKDNKGVFYISKTTDYEWFLNSISFGLT